MKQPNIILIVVDTLRKDYFNQRYLPNLHNLISNDGVFYSHTVSPASWTIPSHASIFAKKYASSHEIHKINGFSDLDILERAKHSDFSSFVSEVRSNGYLTIGYSANPFISSDSIFAKGFDLFLDSEFQNLLTVALNDKITKFIKSNQEINFFSKCRIVMQAGFSEVRTIRNKGYDLTHDKGGTSFVKFLNNLSISQPFFLFVNLMEMHEPYIKSEYNHLLNKSKWSDYFGIRQFSSKERRKIVQNYLKSSTLLDRILSNVVAFLKSAKIYDDSLIIITSDHGQAFWENSFYSHECFLFKEIVEVPLFIKYPFNFFRRGKTTMNKTYSLVDIGNLIENWAAGISDELSFRETVFSESYGFNTSAFPNIKLSSSGAQRFVLASTPRKTVYKGRYNLIVNSNWEIEGLFKEGIKVNQQDYIDIRNDLFDEVENFSYYDRFFKRP